jgi:hypothetical protein
MPVTDYGVSGGETWNDGQGPLYVGLQGRLVTSDDRTQVAQRMSRDGSVTNLRVLVLSSSAGGNVTVTLMIGASQTALTMTIPQGTELTIREDDVHCVDFDTNDELCWRIVSNGTVGGLMGMRHVLARVEDQ